MALRVQRKVVNQLQATQFFTIMVDECTDVANNEQVTIYGDQSFYYTLCVNLIHSTATWDIIM